MMHLCLFAVVAAQQAWPAVGGYIRFVPRVDSTVSGSSSLNSTTTTTTSTSITYSSHAAATTVTTTPTSASVVKPQIKAAPISTSEPTSILTSSRGAASAARAAVRTSSPSGSARAARSSPASAPSSSSTPQSSSSSTVTSSSSSTSASSTALPGCQYYIEQIIDKVNYYGDTGAKSQDDEVLVCAAKQLHGNDNEEHQKAVGCDASFFDKAEPCFETADWPCGGVGGVGSVNCVLKAYCPQAGSTYFSDLYQCPGSCGDQPLSEPIKINVTCFATSGPPVPTTQECFSKCGGFISLISGGQPCGADREYVRRQASFCKDKCPGVSGGIWPKTWYSDFNTNCPVQTKPNGGGDPPRNDGSDPPRNQPSNPGGGTPNTGTGSPNTGGTNAGGTGSTGTGGGGGAGGGGGDSDSGGSRSGAIVAADAVAPSAFVSSGTLYSVFGAPVLSTSTFTNADGSTGTSVATVSVTPTTQAIGAATASPFVDGGSTLAGVGAQTIQVVSTLPDGTVTTIDQVVSGTTLPVSGSTSIAPFILPTISPLASADVPTPTSPAPAVATDANSAAGKIGDGRTMLLAGLGIALVGVVVV